MKREREISLRYCQSAMERNTLLQGTAHHSHSWLLYACVRACFWMYDVVQSGFPHIWTYMSICTSFYMHACLNFNAYVCVYAWGLALQCWPRGYRGLLHSDLHPAAVEVQVSYILTSTCNVLTQTTTAFTVLSSLGLGRHNDRMSFRAGTVLFLVTHLHFTFKALCFFFPQFASLKLQGYCISNFLINCKVCLIWKLRIFAPISQNNFT